MIEPGTWSARLVAAFLVVPACFAVGWGVTELCVAIALRRLRRAQGAPWVERARLAFPARELVTANMLLVSLGFGGITYLRVAPGLAPAFWGAIAGLAGLLGAMTAGVRLERRLVRRDGARPSPGVPVHALLVLIGLGPYWLMLPLIPTQWGWTAAAVLALGVALLSVVNGGGWLFVLRRLGLARPASPRLCAIVDQASVRVGVRPRAIFELDSPHANAVLAWPVPRFLMFTGPMLAVLDDDELAAIAAHELGHLDEPWGVYLTRLAVPYLVVCAFAGIPLGGSFGLSVGLVPYLVMLAGLVVLGRLGRRMEVRSDRVVREHEGADAGTYARALEKIYEANLMPVVMRSKQMAHPHLYDRMIAAGVTPSYPRPEAPAWDHLANLLLYFLLFVFLMVFVTGPPFWPVIR